MLEAIPSISGLERSSRLEQLWLNENDIRSLQGLEACSSLKALYCCSNRLTSIGTALVNTKELEARPPPISPR